MKQQAKPEEYEFVPGRLYRLNYDHVNFVAKDGRFVCFVKKEDVIMALYREGHIAFFLCPDGKVHGLFTTYLTPGYLDRPLMSSL